MMDIYLPPLIYGTAWKEKRTADLVVMAIRSGFRGIDTACQPKHYHEAGVGEALRRLSSEGIGRNELFIQTKYTPLGGHDIKRIPYDPTAPLEVQVEQSFSRSLENLGVEYLDSYLLHSPVYPYEDLLRVWRSMERIVETGGSRRIGISNLYDLALLERLYADARIKPSLIQNRFYADTAYDERLRSWMRARGIAYQSFWSLTANPHLLSSVTVHSAAHRYGRTPAQILFRFLTQIGIIPLIGSTSIEHLREDLEIFDFLLSEEEIRGIVMFLGFSLNS